MRQSGFTLIELVIVMVLIGILAVIALPKFTDVRQDAKIAAAKSSLAEVRAAISLKYLKNKAGGTTPYWPSTMVASDFHSGVVPTNKLNNQSGIGAVSTVPAGTAPIDASNGWWLVTATTGAGMAGAYSDGTVQTSDW